LIKLLLINYVEDALQQELLKKGYEISTANSTRGIGNNSVFDQMDKRTFDIIYFAKFMSKRDDFDVMFQKVKTPTIYAFHGPSIIFRPFRPRNYLHNVTSTIKLAYAKIARPVTAIHALNIDEFKLLKVFGFKCYYAPLGVDTGLFRPSVKSSRFTVIFVGARYQKGADMLFRIVPKLLKKAPDIKLIITGVGFLSGYLNQLKRVFSDNVEIREWIPSNEFVKLFSSAHILLFPSRWETFGLVVLEALSSGMPVVCYDINGAPRDIVKVHNVGKAANAFDTEEIVINILEYHNLWRNRNEKFEKLSKRCRLLALNYDWKNVSELFDSMFQQELAKN
jgi:glycosyltransferase involved in cell wall biosynthesis